ncbi:MAG TPA: hypothetical protein PK446_04250, partial [Methanomassiliicoccaceae archaeon]|nr:hypothetical protein [Methanomassiliicoccaceae archaeon]
YDVPFQTSAGIFSNTHLRIPSIMSPPEMAFEYDDLTEVYRKEQRTKNITEVRKDLYEVIRKKLAELRRDSEREFAMDQFSTRAKLAANQLTKFQEKADQVFEFRMEKILAMALRAAQGNRVDTGRLTPEEIRIFESVSSLIRERHKALLDMEAGEEVPPPRLPPVPPIEPPACEQEEMEEPVPPMDDEGIEELEQAAMEPEDVPGDEETHAYTPPATLDAEVLRILEDLPPFAGPGRDYHLKKEDVVCLPPPIAKALVARNKAVTIRIAGSRR